VNASFVRLLRCEGLYLKLEEVQGLRSQTTGEAVGMFSSGDSTQLLLNRALS